MNQAAATVKKTNGKPAEPEQVIALPQQDMAAERALLGAMILDASHIEPVFEVTDPEHFCGTPHRWLARSIKTVWESGKPVDVVTIAEYLKDIGRLSESGGTKYLADLLDTTPVCLLPNSIHFAEIVRRKWELRSALAEARVLEAVCQTGCIEDVSAAFFHAASQVEHIVTGTQVEVLSGNAIFAVSDHIDTLIPGLGIKPGPATGIYARGGLGKSVILQLATLDAVMGEPLWGLFPVQRPLRVLWNDLEQGPQTTLLRFKRGARAKDLVPQDLEGNLDIQISPDVSSEAKMERLLRGYDLAFFDCFRVMAAGEDENSSAIRGPLDALARASDRAGCACVMVHHARKLTENSRGGGHDASRGSSAIMDAFDGAFYLDRPEDDNSGPITCTCTKVPRATGKAPEPWTLQIEDCDIWYNDHDVDRGAGLRVIGKREPKVDSFTAEAVVNRNLIERLKAELVAEFAENPVQPGADTIAANLGRKAANVRRALLVLVNEEMVKVEGAGRNLKHVWTGGRK